jgi:hypothetical protein
MPRYNTRSRTYRRESDDGSEGSIDWDAVERGEERKIIPRSPKTKEKVTATDPWSGTTQGSHLTTPDFIYLPKGRILIQGMLDHFPRMASRTYESTHNIDFASLHMIGVREEFFRLMGRAGFTASFWTI